MNNIRKLGEMETTDGLRRDDFPELHLRMSKPERCRVRHSGHRKES
jgi:hypothetical protein